MGEHIRANSAYLLSRVIKLNFVVGEIISTYIIISRLFIKTNPATIEIERILKFALKFKG
ncbi:hypothetical protein MTHERMMSTA1_25550 [Methanosarcina thermophila MST-A1]|nr:hypothetical protein MTHERMMSTA1_25550 [Methanosarcina thermophila MST-A1]